MYSARIISRLTLALLVVSGLLISSVTAEAAAKEVVRFRLVDWRSIHLDDEKKANEITVTLKKLGCEAGGHSHGDHIDLRYRCVKWRSITVKDHSQAHQWEKWLKTLKFETKHEH